MRQIHAQESNSNSNNGIQFDTMSPLYQHLPDCRKKFVRISKQTTEKGLICPMFRDEEGFLAEFTVSEYFVCDLMTTHSMLILFSNVEILYLVSLLGNAMHKTSLLYYKLYILNYFIQSFTLL
jgi:hypothetical protein